MLIVESQIMFQYVHVTKDTLETHFQAATDHQQQLQDQKSLIPADQVLVESMLSVEKEMELLLAPAYQECLETHMFSANLSVPSIQSVPPTEPVLTRSVLTHVQEFVEPMQAVLCKITIPHAHVTLVTLETPSDTVQELQHCQCQQRSSILVHPHLVDQMLSVIKETEQPHVSVYQTTLETPMLPADLSV